MNIRTRRIDWRAARAGLTVCVATITYTIAGTACATEVLTTPVTEAPTGALAGGVIPTEPGAQLDALIASAYGMGEQILAANGRQSLETFDALWAVVRPQVQPVEPVAVTRMDAQVTMLTRGVEFNRAADAEKAARNLDSLFAAFRTAHPDIFAS